MLFREDKLRQYKSMGMRVRACSPQTWTMIHDDFKKLSGEELADYKRRSDASFVEAQENRSRRRAHFAALANETTLEPLRPHKPEAAPVADAPGASADAMLVAVAGAAADTTREAIVAAEASRSLKPDRACACCKTLGRHHVPEHATPMSFALCMPSTTPDAPVDVKCADVAALAQAELAAGNPPEYPLCSKRVEEAIKAKSCKKIAAQFRDDCAEVVVGTSIKESDRFPSDVSYQKCCGPICLSTIMPRSLRFLAEFLRFFETFANSFKKQTSLASADVLLVFDIATRAERRVIMYAFLVCSRRHHGKEKPWQGFTMCRVAQEGDSHTHGVRLSVETKKMVDLTLTMRSPFSRDSLRAGALNNFTAPQLAAHLLELLDDDDDGDGLASVRVQRLAHLPLSLSDVRVVGLFEPKMDTTFYLLPRPPTTAPPLEDAPAPHVDDDDPFLATSHLPRRQMKAKAKAESDRKSGQDTSWEEAFRRLGGDPFDTMRDEDIAEAGPFDLEAGLGELLADELGEDLSADVRELWEAFLATKRSL